MPEYAEFTCCKMPCFASVLFGEPIKLIFISPYYKVCRGHYLKMKLWCDQQMHHLREMIRLRHVNLYLYYQFIGSVLTIRPPYLHSDTDNCLCVY